MQTGHAIAVCPCFFEVRLTVFAALLALAGPAMSHGCEDHLPLYLQGSYEGGCDESTELAHGHGEARGADHYVGEWVQGKPVEGVSTPGKMALDMKASSRMARSMERDGIPLPKVCALRAGSQ